jgi:acetolactate synthase-1/2/3 large subunit
VHLALPQDVLNEATPEDEVYPTETGDRYPAHRTRADAQAESKAAELLLSAQRPILIAGGGAVISQAWEEITALAEHLAMPVATSINGKGSIVEDHPLSLGVVGGNGGRAYAHDMIREADLVFYVGCKTDSVTTMNWTLPPADGRQTIIQLDADPAEIGNRYRTACGLVGDAKLTLADLVQAVRQMQKQPRDVRARAQEIAARSLPWWAEFARRAGSLHPSGAVSALSIVHALQETLPSDYVIVADPGTMTPVTAAYFRSAAGRRVVIPRAFGGLGYALPGVVGAKLAKPEAAVIGLLGDGSLGMSVGELETIHRLGLPVVLIHFNNGCFGWIKTLQHLQHGARYFGVDFAADTDVVKIAEGFGLRALRVSQPQELAPAIRQALASGVATFIDVPTAPEYVEVPPVAKWEYLAGVVHQRA